MQIEENLLPIPPVMCHLSSVKCLVTFVMFPYVKLFLCQVCHLPGFCAAHRVQAAVCSGSCACGGTDL